MNKRLTSAAIVLAASVCYQQTVLGQENETRGVPVEFFACNFVDGKDMDDLKPVTDQFKKWAKKHDMSYSAWTMTPQFHNEADMFDLGWLGSWTDGNAFGKGQDAWMTKGRDMAAAFAGVIDCSSRHELATSVEINAPDGAPEDGVVLFSQCRLKEGKSYADSLAAHNKLAAEMTALGSKASSWLFYPGLGAGDVDFHYWRVIGFNNYTELGAAAEIFTNGGGWEKTRDILGPVASCGSASVFDARQVVAGESN